MELIIYYQFYLMSSVRWKDVEGMNHLKEPNNSFWGEKMRSNFETVSGVYFIWRKKKRNKLKWGCNFWTKTSFVTAKASFLLVSSLLFLSFFFFFLFFSFFFFFFLSFLFQYFELEENHFLLVAKKSKKSNNNKRLFVRSSNSKKKRRKWNEV